MSFEDAQKESTFEELDYHSSSSSSLSGSSNEDLSNVRGVKNEQRPIRQASDVICELSWSVRDEIILHLNRHSALLVGKRVSTNAKKSMMKSNVQLLDQLMNLPMKTGDQTERSRLIDDRGAGGSNEINEIILEIDWQAKTRLINCLTENHHFAILYSSSVSEESKLELVKHNKEAINSLMNLPFRIETLGMTFWLSFLIFF